MSIIHGGTILDGGRDIFTVKLGSPALGTTTAVHAAAAGTGAAQTLTTGITNPPTARAISATAGGTAASIPAAAVTVKGTDANGDALTEALPAFTAATAGTKTGSKAFATVTEIDIPATFPSAVTVSIGLGAALGLPFAVTRDTVIAGFLDGVRESTRPTVVIDADDVSGNTIALSSALDGSAVIVDLYEA